MRVPRASEPAPARGDHSEADLVQRCLEGDAAAWDTLARVYWKRVFNTAYKFVAQFDEAEDLTQEIFLKLFRALPTYDRRASFETWLTRVSRNLCIDRYRRRRREEERFTDEVDPDTIPLDELVSRPDATLEQRDQVAMVRRALAKLPPMYREAVALRDVHDLSYEEIAHLGEFGLIPRAPFRDASEIAAPVDVSSDARVNAYHWNGNLKVRPFEVGALAPYVTGGIGSFTSETVVSDVMVGPARFEDRRTATNFATNVGAGVNYQISRWVGVGADYRTFFVHRDESTPRVHRFSTGLTFSLK